MRAGFREVWNSPDGVRNGGGCDSGGGGWDIDEISLCSVTASSKRSQSFCYKV